MESHNAPEVEQTLPHPPGFPLPNPLLHPLQILQRQGRPHPQRPRDQRQGQMMPEVLRLLPANPSVFGGDLLPGFRILLPPCPLDLTPQMVPVDLPHVAGVNLPDLSSGRRESRQIPLVAVNPDYPIRLIGGGIWELQGDGEGVGRERRLPHPRPPCLPLVQQPAILVMGTEGEDDGLRIPRGDRDRDGQELPVPFNFHRLPDQID
jgi:hypothetical protein